MKDRYIARHRAAFINALAEEGTKEETIEWLQRIWDDYVDLFNERRVKDEQPPTNQG